jgi:hypothetical protein
MGARDIITMLHMRDMPDPAILRQDRLHVAGIEEPKETWNLWLVLVQSSFNHPTHSSTESLPLKLPLKSPYILATLFDVLKLILCSHLGGWN